VAAAAEAGQADEPGAEERREIGLVEPQLR
jgi:hypothetical protein